MHIVIILYIKRTILSHQIASLANDMRKGYIRNAAKLHLYNKIELCENISSVLISKEAIITFMREREK